MVSLPDCTGFGPLRAIGSKNHLMNHWLYRRLVEPLLALLRQGMTPSSLALCVSIGVVVGNIPILGVSTILCTIIALAFRLNLAAMQLAQAAMAPTQILLIIPFVRLGEWIARAPRQPLSIKEGLALIEQGGWHAVIVLWDAIVHGGIAWILVAPIATFVLYRILTPIFARAAARVRRNPIRAVPVASTPNPD
jgi:uncharacterized protein (DUF2062 family)